MIEGPKSPNSNSDLSFLASECFYVMFKVLFECICLSYIISGLIASKCIIVMFQDQFKCICLSYLISGLRHFSMKVCEKVQAKGLTSYNEVADELVSELTDPRYSCTFIE
jgi:hypothetical protein